MTVEQRGLFRELIDHQWIDGSLPADEMQLQRLASATPAEFSRSWPAVKHQFVRRGNRLLNNRLERVRKEQLAKVEQRSAAGKTAAAKRWNKDA